MAEEKQSAGNLKQFLKVALAGKLRRIWQDAHLSHKTVNVPIAPTCRNFPVGHQVNRNSRHLVSLGGCGKTEERCGNNFDSRQRVARAGVVQRGSGSQGKPRANGSLAQTENNYL
jgi:hypothetical protein